MNYETKDYEVVQFKKGDFQDNYGNYWCDMALRGIGEPVRIAVKDPTQFHDGQTLYGTIEVKQSKAGKDYLKFKRLEKEEHEQQAPLSATGGTTKKEWIPRDDDAIRAQWAIGQAVQLQTAFAKQKNDPALLRSSEVEDAAKYFYAMVERVKAPQQTQLITTETSIEEIQARTEAARDAQRIQDTVRDEIYDVSGEPINLEDIPF